MKSSASVVGGRRLAAIARTGGGWALVIAERAGVPRILEARTFDEGQGPAIIDAVRAASVGLVLRIAPARNTVAKLAEIPAGPGSEMNAAAALLAEANLPDDLPPHRRGAGVVRTRVGPSGSAFALLTGWRGAPPDAIGAMPQSWTTDIAALASLTGGVGAALCARREDGAISIVVHGPERLVVRVLVEPGHDERAWPGVVGRHLADAGARAGIDPSIQAPSSGALALSRDAISLLHRRIEGVRDDAAWLGHFGVCVGAVLAETNGTLASLSADPPVVADPAPIRAARWLSVPRHAVLVSVLAVLASLVAPLAAAGIRLAILSAKGAPGESASAPQADVRQLAAMYRELGNTRWPMTKLWSDISQATPVGVRVESLRLSPEQGLSIQGQAEDAETVNELQANLNATKLFEKLRIGRSEETPTGVSFELSADVVGPHTAVSKPADDFDTKPLAVRLYGEEARTAPAGPASDSTSDRGSPGNGAARSPRGEGGTGREERAGARPTGSKPPDIPAPLSDAEITALDFGKANLEWVKRKTAIGKAPDAAVKARLEDEVKKLDAHRTALRSKAPGGGS